MKLSRVNKKGQICSKKVVLAGHGEDERRGEVAQTLGGAQQVQGCVTPIVVRFESLNCVSGEVDDMTLCLTFVEETDSDGSLSHRPALRGSTTSLHSNISDLSLPPPPLPNTLPPPSRTMASPSNESYYLPSSHHGEDSADEASEIVDEDDATYGLTHKRRAKSADRDSDFSEILPLGSSPQQVRRRKKLSQHTSSLESIPDSGVGTLRQTDGDMLREKISAMEKQLKVRMIVSGTEYWKYLNQTKRWWKNKISANNLNIYSREKISLYKQRFCV